MSSPAAFRLTAFELDDLDAILEIERAAPGRPWSRGQFVDETRSSFSRFIVARSATPDRVAGFIIWWLVLDEVQIFNVAVHPDFRRRGVGSLLIDHALEDGRRRGATTATLEVHCSNQSALALYRAHGFVETGRRLNYYGRDADAVLMERSLAAPDGIK